MAARTPEEIAEQIETEYATLYTDLGSARYDAAIEAIRADRAQRSDRRVLTVPSEGVRIAVESPREVFEVLTDLLTDYTFDQIEWEKN